MQAPHLSEYAAQVLPEDKPSISNGVPLAELAPGTQAVIVDVTARGPLHNRLHDLGFLPGTRVKVVRRAPLGEPVLYEVRGYRISLRTTETERIIVNVDGGTP